MSSTESEDDQQNELANNQMNCETDLQLDKLILNFEKVLKDNKVSKDDFVSNKFFELLQLNWSTQVSLHVIGRMSSYIDNLSQENFHKLKEIDELSNSFQDLKIENKLVDSENKKNSKKIDKLSNELIRKNELIKNLNVKITLLEDSGKKVQNFKDENENLRKEIETLNDLNAKQRLKRYNFGKNLIKIVEEISKKLNLELNLEFSSENEDNPEKIVYKTVQDSLIEIYKLLN